MDWFSKISLPYISLPEPPLSQILSRFPPLLLEMAHGGEETNKSPCCISHEFFRSASENPSAVAVVHASGGLQLCRELRGLRSSVSGAMEEEHLMENYKVSSHPPVYRGDVCFTYGDILLAVDCLSHRIRRVLDGYGDDTGVVRPRGRGYPTRETNRSVSIGNKRFPLIVGVNIGPSVEYIVAVLSILRCGEAFLPLDPLWPAERIASIASSSNIALAIKCKPPPPSSRTIGSFEQNGADRAADMFNCPVLYLSMEESLRESVGRSELAWPCEAGSPRLFCYLMYTSGSTGKPKGVCGTEKGIVNRFMWMRGLYLPCKEDLVLFKTSISFIDHVQEFLGAILTCTALVVPPFEELKANPLYLVDILNVYCVSRLIVVPSLMRAVVPVMQSFKLLSIQRSLKLLVLSGETLSISLWSSMRSLFPQTTILNLYGTTEVSGDCTYFDCSNLPKILETEDLSTVPIGIPIPNCDIVLHGEPQMPDEGEIHVGGSCLFVGYISDLCHGLSNNDNSAQLHFSTGDFARCLQSGDLVFIGRKDRTIKVNGQRIALEEIENVLREHPVLDDAAVSFHRTSTDSSYLRAYIVPQNKDRSHNELLSFTDVNHVNEGFLLSIKSWLLRQLPLTMIPSHYLCVERLPLSSSGKVDLVMLEASTSKKKQWSEFNNDRYFQNQLQIIKEAFSDALMVQEFMDQDDFFVMGGSSIAAAQVAHKLGIDMRLLYLFPSPTKLLNALLKPHEQNSSFKTNQAKRLKVQDNSGAASEEQLRIFPLQDGDSSSKFDPSDMDSSPAPKSPTPINDFKRLTGQDTSGAVNEDELRVVQDDKDDSSRFGPSNKDSSLSPAPKSFTPSDDFLWESSFSAWTCSFSRCNRSFHEGKSTLTNVHDAYPTIDVSRSRNGFLQELWTVPLKSCVDASPLLVLKDGDIHLFIGSHSHIFMCVNAVSGTIRWEVKLEGRVECSAAITADFSQVVVGCYKGRIYFIDFISGHVSWVFQTEGEVKMQPVAYKNLIWCGSHDHRLYALDFHRRCCVYEIPCGGSIYGSPAIDLVRNMLYVATTSGRVTAISVEVLPFCISWSYESGAPIFGSPCLDPSNGNVICCLVDGSVFALNSKGSLIWRAVTGGPIFAGACMSSVLPSEVLICSRNGSVYSFELEGGRLLWEYQIGDPITSAAYVDEHIQLISEPSLPPDRLACICSSSGSVHVLRIKSGANRNRLEEVPEIPFVQKFASIQLPGDIFSSPVMIGGRIFVGCRDDNVHCIRLVCQSIRKHDLSC